MYLYTLSTNLHTCSVFINGEKLSEHADSDKNRAKEGAACKVFFGA